MRNVYTKNFVHDGKDSVKIGPVELYREELEKYIEEGRTWILVRDCAYFVAGKATRTDENGKPVFYYNKVKTADQRNTLPGRHFVLTWEQVRGYVDNSFKVWHVDFDTLEKAQDEEYYARHEGGMETRLQGMGGKFRLYVKCDRFGNTFFPDWYKEKAFLSPSDPQEIRRIFGRY